MAISFVQGKGYGSSINNETSHSLAFTSNTTAGNTIVVFGAAYSNTAAPVQTISDGVNTYTIVQQQAGTGGSSSYMWVAKNIAGGSTTVTVTSNQTGTTGFDFIIMEYSGLSATAPVDSSACHLALANSGVNVSTAAIYPHYVNEVLVLFGYDQTNDSDTFTFSSSPTLTLTQRVIDSIAESETVDSINTFVSVSAYTPSVKINKNSNALHIIAAFLTDAATPLSYITPFAEVLKGGTTGLSYSETLSANGGVSPYTYSLLSGSLPTGLSLTSGVISGTPTGTGTSTFVIQATDTNGSTGSTTFQITISSSAPTGGGSFVFLG